MTDRDTDTLAAAARAVLDARDRRLAAVRDALPYPFYEAARRAEEQAEDRLRAALSAYEQGARP